MLVAGRSRAPVWPARARLPSTAAANVAPQCDAGLASQVLRTGKAMKLRVYCSDADLDSPTVNHSSPDHGTLGTFVFNPGANALRGDLHARRRLHRAGHFNFNAYDGTTDDVDVRLQPDITSQPRAPCEPNGAVHTKVSDRRWIFNVFCADQDAQTRTSTTRSSPAGPGPRHLGTLVELAVHYTPNTSFSGADTSRSGPPTAGSRRLYSAAHPHCEHAALPRPRRPCQIRSGRGALPGHRLHAARRRLRSRPLRDRHAAGQGQRSPERHRASRASAAFFEADGGAEGADSYTSGSRAAAARAHSSRRRSPPARP